MSSRTTLKKQPSVSVMSHKVEPLNTKTITSTGNSEEISKNTELHSINLSIPVSLKTRKPRCCTHCKVAGHYKNKCPELMSKTPIQPTPVQQITTSTSVIPERQGSIRHTTIAGQGPPTPRTEVQGPPTPRTEVQGHGKTWENDILINVYKADPEIIKSSNYTQVYDLKAVDNKLNQCNLSVKTTGSGTVYMGDCLRIFNSVSSGDPYHLVLINYVQRGQHKHVTRILEFDLTGFKDPLFGQLTREQIKQLDMAVKAIPQKHKPTTEERKVLYDLKKTLQPLSGAISLDIKCNSQQSRLQCSISSGKFKELLSRFPERVIAASNTNEFRGGIIRESIASDKRTFKKKKIAPTGAITTFTDSNLVPGQLSAAQSG